MIYILFLLAIIAGFLYLSLIARYFNPYARIFQPETLSDDFKFISTHSFEEVYLPVTDDVKMHAVHIKIGFPKGVVLYFHGNEGNIDSCLQVADDFLVKGYNLFIIDYRGFGKSKGDIKKAETLYEDVEVAYNYLRTLYSEDTIIVYGRSLGAPIATYVASINSPQSLVLECPPANFQDIAKIYYPSFIYNTIIQFDYSTEKWIGAVKCPIYFFHADGDKIIPSRCSKKLASMATASSKVHITSIHSSSHYTLRNYLEYQIQLEKILHPSMGKSKKPGGHPSELIINPVYKILNS